MSRYRREKWKREEGFQSEKPTGSNIENFHTNVYSTSGVKFLFEYLTLQRVNKPNPPNAPPPKSDIRGARPPDSSLGNNDPTTNLPGGLFGE